MNGLKSVEQLIEKYGVTAFSDDTPFIKRVMLGKDDAMRKNMPFCFFRKLEAMQDNDCLWCYTAFMPSKKQRLAMYLVDKSNTVIEQVYFLRDRRGVVSCEKIQRLLSRSLASSNASNYELAA